jgi:alcohol dehydrogenase
LLCAGVATFNALKRCGAEAGDTVAILGIGGLGHMAIQYARHMGFRVVAVGRGGDIAEDALALGAHVYLDNHQEDVAAKLQAMGGAQAILTTIAHPEAINALLGGLAPRGQLVQLGVGKEPLTVTPGLLVGGERSVVGSLTGSPFDSEKTLNFSVLSGARPMIETLPLEQANTAYRRMTSGEAKFRMVLTMDG